MSYLLGNDDNDGMREDEFDPPPEYVPEYHATGATIWGTDVNVDTCTNVFREFLTNFVIGNNYNSVPHYMRLLEVLHKTQNYVLNIDCAHLRDHMGTRRLFHQLISYPQEIIPIMDEVCNNEYCKTFGVDSTVPVRIQVLRI